MAISWSEIEYALDEVIAHEEGVRFQRLAISLAKQRWSEVVATEVKKDGGEDALTHPHLTKDGKKFDIAASLTATLDKVRKDAKKISERGINLDLLIFYTAKKVQNTTVDEWRKEITNEFSHDLLVISREDIILELLKPQNEWLCSKFLDIQVPVKPGLDDVVSKAVIAVAKTLEQWKRRIQFTPKHLIDLDTVKLDDRHRPTGEIYNLRKICSDLADGGRINLFGAAGAGKTTTLIQIARYFLDEKEGAMPLLISLPEWIKSRSDILTFVTRHPDFVGAGISQSDLGERLRGQT